MRVLGRAIAGLLGAAFLTVCLGREARAQRPGADFVPVTQETLNDPDPEDWLMWRGGYRQWGYSPLEHITRDNVRELQLAWSYALAAGGPGSGGMQVEPTVYDGVMYVRHPNERYSAHDATTGDVLWQYSRPLPD